MSKSGYSKKQRTSDEPFNGGAQVSPNDSTNLSPAPARGLWIGVGGTLKVDIYDPTGNATTTVQTTCDGGLFPFLVVKVWNTGTSASQILAGY